MLICRERGRYPESGEEGVDSEANSVSYPSVNSLAPAPSHGVPEDYRQRRPGTHGPQSEDDSEGGPSTRFHSVTDLGSIHGLYLASPVLPDLDPPDLQGRG